MITPVSAPSAAGVRVLFVHAHPDDESILTGGTMASLAARGAHVALLTATRGEGGEVIGEELAHLEGDREALAAHREQELAAAVRVLGTADHRYLGDTESAAAAGLPARRFEDSGMEWGPDGHAAAPAQMPEAALCRVPVDTAARYVAAVIAQVQPQLVITYGDGGGYGHPDHRHMHHATVAAVASMPQAERPVLLFADIPQDAAAAAFDPQRPGFELTGFAPAEQIPTIPASAPIAVAQDVSEHQGAKAMAMAAHATQVTVAGEFFALSNGIGQHIADVEHYTLWDSEESIRAEAPAADVLEMIPEAQSEQSGSPQPLVEESPQVILGPAEIEPSVPAKPGAGAVIHAVLMGVLIGILGAFQHLNASAFDLAGQSIIVPWGLALSLALAFAGLWHIGALYRSTRLLVASAALISVIGFILGQPAILPGADIVITGTLRSLSWLFGPMVIAALLAFTMPALRRPSATGESAARASGSQH